MKAQDIIRRIDEGYDADKRERAREYIGASIVGHACDAMLAFNLRGFPNDEPSPRLKRIFQLGHIMEDQVVEDLKKRADVRVWEVDALTGRQHSYEEYGGHVVCHMDGHIQLSDASDEVLVLEIKTMNDASFGKFKSSGVKRSHPQYYAQLQMMMGMSGFERSFFIATNKNTSEYWAEIVDADPFEYGFLRERVARALEGRAMKVATDESDWRCRGCFKASVCWGDKPVPVKCQTCSLAIPTADGWWHCDRHDRPITDTPCPQYERFTPRPRMT